jgi:Transposase
MSDGVTFAGIDWASMLHVACVVDGDGQVVDRFEFTHDAAAITDMIRRVKRVKASGVAIERGDGPVVEALMDSGLAVYVVPPRLVDNSDTDLDEVLSGSTRRSQRFGCIAVFAQRVPAVSITAQGIRKEIGIEAVVLVARRAISFPRFSGITFSSRDVVPLAYAAFAFTLGVTVGLVMRRTVPAMAVTLAVFVGIQILVPTIIRPNLLSSTTVSFSINRAIASQATGIYSNDGSSAFNIVLPVPLGAWVIAAPPVANASGHVAASAGISNCLMPPPSGPGKTGGPSIEKIVDCLAKYDLHEGVTYQPASHYWPLQWYESGIFLLLAAALSGSCFWLIRRRRN